MAVAFATSTCATEGESTTDTAASIPTPDTFASATTSPMTSGPQAAESTQLSSDTTATLAPLVSLAYEVFATGLGFPVFLTPLPGTELLVIATKDGRLLLADDIDLHGEPFLDIAGRVRDKGEQGLLGVAFSPDYKVSGRFFVHYSANDGNTILSEFTVTDFLADPATEVIVFEVDQPAANHNGGMIQFGPDGFLYMGLGDGGGANDRFGNGQDGSTPLGALLRFDASTPGKLVPAGSGFESPEVWAIGLRNPWRFSIDPISNLVFIGDVGQADYEEISVADVGVSGLNYGWPVTEGLHCFRPTSGCSSEGITFPIVEIAHTDSETCSVTGGVVYRGTAIPELYGHYLYSDYCGGYLRSVDIALVSADAIDWTDQVGSAGNVASFGVDAAGEVYVLNGDGDVLKLIAVRR